MASAEKDQLGADLSAYLDGELSPERTREIEQFLAESEDARQTLADLRAISEDLAGLPRTRAPRGLPEMVSRGSERQVLLQEQAPVRRTRVLKIFARITASAALIVACVFAGWTVLQRVNPPTPSRTGRGIATGRAPAAPAEGVKTFARRASPDEAKATEATATPAMESDGEAPAIAMADELEAWADAEASEVQEFSRLSVADASPPSSDTPEVTIQPTMGYYVVGGAASDNVELGTVALSDAAPAISVFVTPRDADQYNASLQNVVLWQQARPATAGLAAGDLVGESSYGLKQRSGLRKEAGREYAPARPTQQDFIFQVPPSRFNEMLLSLERQAPQQVQVVINFTPNNLPEVQRMVLPTEAAPRRDTATLAKGPSTPPGADQPRARAEAPARERGRTPAEMDAFEAGRFAGRGGARGRVVRQPARSKAGVSAETEEEKSRRAGERGSQQALEAETLERLESLGYVGAPDDSDEPKDEPPADKKKTLADPRHPRVADVARGVPVVMDDLDAAGEAYLDSKPEPGARLPPVALSIRQSATDIRARLMEIYETMLGVALRTDLPTKHREPPPAPAPQPQPAPVTLRVTLLPPPATAQPSAQPVPPAPQPEKP